MYRHQPEYILVVVPPVNYTATSREKRKTQSRLWILRNMHHSQKQIHLVLLHSHGLETQRFFRLK